MVKDHRTGTETSNVQAVMDGDIDMFIQAKLHGEKSTKGETKSIEALAAAERKRFWHKRRYTVSASTENDHRTLRRMRTATGETGDCAFDLAHAREIAPAIRGSDK